MTKLITVAELKPGDVLVTPYNTKPRTVITIRPATLAQSGRPRRRPAVQAHIISADEDRELYSDTMYRESLVRVRF